MKTWSAILPCLWIASSLADARMAHMQKRAAAVHLLDKRQANNDQSITVGGQNTASNTASGQDGGDGGLLNTLLNPSTAIGSASSPNPLIPPVLSTSSLTSSSTTSVRSISSSSSASSATAASVKESTINLTSTEAAPSNSAAANSQDDKEESGGVNHKTLIIIVSVASAVGLVAAIWTILRKWKFSPSRQFEDRLNPIDWTPEPKEDEKMGSSPSINSLDRRGSWSSNTGSTRGAAMSEVTGYSARPAPSTAQGAYGAAVPAYPPQYVATSNRGYPDYQPQYQAAPYEQVTRQTAQVNGGRYGEAYY